MHESRAGVCLNGIKQLDAIESRRGKHLLYMVVIENMHESRAGVCLNGIKQLDAIERQSKSKLK
jgi:hypothetical protein